MQILSQYKSNIESSLNGLAKKLSWLNPNFITVIGIIPPILFLIFMNQQEWWWAILMLILTPLDMLDGILARANNRVTAFGGFLDSTLDRIADFLIVVGLYAGEMVPLEITASLLLVTFLISYSRSRAELASNNTTKFNFGLIERPERIILITIAVVLHIFSYTPHIPYYSQGNAVIFLLLILSVITFLQRIYYAYKKLN